MKKTIVLFISFVMLLCSFGSVVLASEEGYDFETPEVLVNTQVFDQPVEFPLMPTGYQFYETEHQGTIDRLYYTTDAYDDGVEYKKYVTVYLPYGYDPDDKDTKYNVLYFQHGHQQHPNQLWDRPTQEFNPKRMVDNFFDPDHQAMEPFIIISPSYYFDVKKKTQFIADGNMPAGDGRTEGIPGNYYREIVEDLIPQIESQYNVYCEDFSEEGIKASRDHRAFTGFSRGSMCTWYVMYHDFEYFKYWMPMSGPITIEGAQLGDESRSLTPEEEDACTYIMDAINAHPDLDFFVFATSGGPDDGAGQMMVPQMQEFYQHPEVFSFGTDPEENNFYFTLTEFLHMDSVMPFNWYAAKDILFH